MSDNLSGGTTASFNNTPQAVDDRYSAGEDAGIIIFDVMANDRGGNAKSLWSIDDTSDDGSADLVSKDIAGTAERSELGARIYLTSNGRIAYDTSIFNSLPFGQTVTDQFTYAIRLSNGTLSWATVNVTITGSNDRPIAVADTAAGTENQALTIDVLANDTDVDNGHVFTLLAASAEAGKGVASVAGNQLAYDPGSDFDHLAAGATETVTLSYTMSDEHGARSSSTVTVTITGTNDGPVAVADTAAGTENQALTIDVLANDTDVDDGHAFTLLAASAEVGKGVASVSGNQLAYDPGSDFDHLAAGAAETVTLTYTMSDEHGAQSSSTVTVTITGTNDGPIAVADAASTNENASVAIDVLANDTDVDDGASFTLVSAATPLGGVSISDDTLLFDTGSDFDHLAAGETEAVTINYVMADEHGAQSSSTVTVTVTGTNDAPVIGAGDFGGAILEAEPVTIPAGATPVLVGSGSSTTFAAAQTINRADLRVAANANLGDDSDPAISVTGAINSATDQDVYVIQLAAGETITLDIDFGLGYGAVAYPGYGGARGLDSYVSIFDAAGNLLNVNDDAPTGSGGGGSIYTQDSYLQLTAAAAGAYYIVVHDWQSGSFASQGPYTLQVSVDSQALALTDSGSFAFTDLDLSDGHSVSVTPQGSAYLGTLTSSVGNVSTGDGSGDVRWDFSVANAAVQFLAEGQQLVQTYALAVSDGEGGVDEELVTVTLTGTNDVPVISTALSIGELVEDSVLSADGLISFADVDLDDGHTVTAIAEQAGYVGSFSAALADPSAGDGSGQVGWAFSVDNSEIDQLAVGQRLLQRYTITITDDHGATTQQLVNITITGTNDGPVAVADTAAGTENQTLTINVLANDTDVDNGHVFSLLAASAEAGKGVASVAGNQLVYNPGSDFDQLAAGATETVTLSYTMADQHGAQSSSNVTVTITGTNDAPVAALDFDIINEDQPSRSGNVLANDSDVDVGDELTVLSVRVDPNSGTIRNAQAGQTLQGLLGTLTLNADGSYVYALDSSNPFIQSLPQGGGTAEQFLYTISDGNGGTVEGRLTIPIRGQNDAPVVNGAVTGAAIEDRPGVTLNALANASDVDSGTSLSVVDLPATLPAGVSFNLATNSFTLNPSHDAYQSLAAGDVATVSVNYGVSDGLATTPASVSWTVTGTNDLPNGVADSATAGENQTMLIDVLANDTDVDAGDSLRLVGLLTIKVDGVAATAAQAAAFAIVNNQLSFTPGTAFDSLAAGEAAAVVIQYVLYDNLPSSGVGHLTLTVTGTNDGPVATADSATTSEDVGVAINVLANDSDVDGGTLSLSQVPATSAMGATLSIVNGQIHYNASAAAPLQALNTGQNATDTFTYTVSDGQGATSLASVSVLVNGVTDSGAVADSFATSEDNRVYLDVLANDISPNGKTIVGLNGSSAMTGASAKGAYIEIAQGKIFYNPQNAPTLQALNTGQELVDSFTYTMRDGSGNMSQATVLVDVAGFTEGTVINSGVTATINFNGTGTPLSYTEDNMTVQSLYDPSSAPHLHMQGTYLNNHSGCCSSPYEFRYFNPDNGDTTFSLDSLLNLGGTGVFTSSKGGSVTVSTPGVADFSTNALFDDVEWVRWFSNVGSQNIDNLAFTS